MSAEELGDLLPFEEEIPHPDEKWLVSYADMMTLLFGFFVMLYSMANQMDVVEKSIAEKFAPKGEEAKPSPVKNELGNVEDLTAKVAGLEKALTEAQSRAAAMEKSSQELEDKIFTQSDSLLKSGQLAQQLKSVTEERDKLRSQLAKAQTEQLLEAAKKPVVAASDPAPAKGGGIGGGGSRGAKERIGGAGGVKLRMPVRFENGFTATTIGATNRGFVINADAPGAPGETFVATVDGPDGRAIKVVVKIMLEHGDSRHLGIVHYLTGSEGHLKEWIANAP